MMLLPIVFARLGNQNRSAGGQLVAWYGLDNILHNDQFWVQID